MMSFFELFEQEYSLLTLQFQPPLPVPDIAARPEDPFPDVSEAREKSTFLSLPARHGTRGFWGC